MLRRLWQCCHHLRSWAHLCDLRCEWNRRLLWRTRVDQGFLQSRSLKSYVQQRRNRAALSITLFHQLVSVMFQRAGPPVISALTALSVVLSAAPQAISLITSVIVQCLRETKLSLSFIQYNSSFPFSFSHKHLPLSFISMITALPPPHPHCPLLFLFILSSSPPPLPLLHPISPEGCSSSISSASESGVSREG